MKKAEQAQTEPLRFFIVAEMLCIEPLLTEEKVAFDPAFSHRRTSSRRLPFSFCCPQALSHALFR